VKPSVFVAIPNLGEIRTELALTLLHWIASGQYRLHVFMPMYIQPHHRARNVCHREFLKKEDYGWLLFIDADCVPPVHALDRLLSHDVPIVGGVILAWRDAGPIPVALRWDNEKGGYVPHYGQGLEEVDVVSMGCTLIRRDVLENMPVGSFAWGDRQDGCDGYGEEFVFCRRAKELGFQPYCDYGLLIGHRKPLEILEINRLLLGERP